ncbi:MAG: flavodoxin-dependent (E)-4-hydroxy-3-methylbut-2-enyl-diphosphate synthase [Bacteroidales bacterium]|nr:flavodoxin-dependent (E)-4-hydroxy-3-methylbut-2-enyl-diphosphate synthase [Bacteroidales bacterium]
MEKNLYDTSYTDDISNITRFQSKIVSIGNTPVGYPYPIRVQSMTTTNTNEIEATVEQCIRIIEAGGKYVRITAQGIKEAENLKLIKTELVKRGYTTPLVADIHYNPKAALVAAQFIEKVRINPGNFTDSSLKVHYTDAEYKEELVNIRSKLKPLLDVCKEHFTAIRIGVNHGSLSSRILSKYGDTPLGMAMSMMEFLHICQEEQFFNIVCSIKANNTRIMVYATRLLIKFMKEEGMKYPIHLGVTEAGDSKEGRIKSAVGIGALLADGIGDTIRVSLTEEPEFEIPVALVLAHYADQKASDLNKLPTIEEFRKNPFDYYRHPSYEVMGIGGSKLQVAVGNEKIINKLQQCYDFVFSNTAIQNTNTIIPAPLWKQEKDTFPCFSIENISEKTQYSEQCNFFVVALDTLPLLLEKYGLLPKSSVLIFDNKHIHFTGAVRVFYSVLLHNNILNPVILKNAYNIDSVENFQIHAGFDFGSVLLDGLGDGVFVENAHVPALDVLEASFGILQASRCRFSKTEYISCPSCGRTLFDIQDAVKQIKEKTAHLKGVKIGIMGCIVNGPGEMADADYGFVGAGKGTINLYKQKEVVKKNIPQHEAVDALIALIKDYGDWKEPE